MPDQPKPLAELPASLWQADARHGAYPALTSDLRVDVTVVGGGIAGVMAAEALVDRGLRVALVEKNRLASGVTGHTTAKVSSLHSVTYEQLAASLGVEHARAYGELNEAGLAMIARLVASHSIDCDFERKDNWTYSTSDDDLPRLRNEAETAAALDLPATFHRELPLPFPVAGGVRFTNQAQFHPVKFVDGLAASLADRGCMIFEQTEMLEIDDGPPALVRCTGATITCDQIVIATHFPVPDRGMYFARMFPERSYAVAMRTAEPPPDGMFISVSSPVRSIRAQRGPDGSELVIVGGEGHKVGKDSNTRERLQALVDWAREQLGATDVEFQWSSQDNMPADNVPFIGRLDPRAKNLYTATGFRKWGFAHAAGGALLLADLITGVDNTWADVYSPNRATFKGARKLATENTKAVTKLVADRLLKRSGKDPDELRPGEGAVVSAGLGQVAVARDEDGRLHTVSARCTHLGCIVEWNTAERSWDCPCHGSRFDIDGSVVHGPARHPLAAVEEDDDTPIDIVGEVGEPSSARPAN